MRLSRSILSAGFAVALALPFAACQPEEEEFVQTPPAQEEVGVYEEEPIADQPLVEEPLQEEPQQEEPLQDQPMDGGL